MWFKGFGENPSGEAARTRSVAKRSLKEGDVVTRHVATRTVGGWKYSCS